ncbi:MAG: hypothetical protein AMJ90_01975 [candidate division Zixibacteria bacterium SM23_73_2]|nr:MAG: hypothetical protein AMJ90_01975 [candidate division Zixibacteria bacterium SM23_73_2]
MDDEAIPCISGKRDCFSPTSSGIVMTITILFLFKHYCRCKDRIVFLSIRYEGKTSLFGGVLK